MTESDTEWGRFEDRDKAVAAAREAIGTQQRRLTCPKCGDDVGDQLAEHVSGEPRWELDG